MFQKPQEFRGIPKDVFNETAQEKYAKALVSEMMSSEDEPEDENGQRHFLVRKPKFRTKKVCKTSRLLMTVNLQTGQRIK